MELFFLQFSQVLFKFFIKVQESFQEQCGLWLNAAGHSTSASLPPAASPLGVKYLSLHFCPHNHLSDYV